MFTCTSKHTEYIWLSSLLYLIEMRVNCLYFDFPTYRTNPLCKHGKFSRLRNSVFIIV